LAEPAAPGGQPGWRSPPALLLIAANLVPLWGVLVWDWPVFPLLVLFWAENVILGVLNVLRMLLADPADLPLWATKLFMVPFFCVHYGMFTAGHGLFVFTFFGGDAYEPLIDDLWTHHAFFHAVHEYQLWAPLAVLAGSHLFSFIWNYIGRGEYLRAEVDNLMVKPYARIIVLHVTIILGGLAAMALGSPVWALLLLLAMKTGIDLGAHLREHRALQQTPGR
jgi:hypothetical protein